MRTSNLAIACLASVTSCKRATPTNEPVEYLIPSSVAPLFGLDVLRAGMTPAQAHQALSKPTASKSTVLGPSLEDAANGIKAQLRFDSSGLADIAIRLQSCADINVQLEAKWGPAAKGMFVATPQLIWSAPGSDWFASEGVSNGPCELVFTNSGYFGEPASPPADLRNLVPGISRSDATKISPELATSSVAVPSASIVDANEAVVYTASGDVENTYVIMPPRAVFALRRAWGDGVGLDGGQLRTTWFAPKTHQRATLVDNRLTFDRALPWSEWLGSGTSIAAFGEDIVGLTVDELRAKRAKTLREFTNPAQQTTVFDLLLPASQWDPDSFSTATVHIADGKVASVGLSLIYDNKTTHAEILKTFTSKWGRGTKTAEGWNFRDGPRMIQVVDLGDTDFQINLQH